MVEIERWNREQAEAALDRLIILLQNAVESGASIGFLPPLGQDEAAAYWRKVIDDLPGGSRLLVVAHREGQLVGAAQLALEMRKNGLHRGEVQRVMVHTEFRQQGIGKQLMLALEAAARVAGRTLLVL
jgi:GNAT superfamily N-acetyltransferase